MKTISLLITLVFLFSLGAGVLAQETELPDPGLTPDSPFYFLERIAEEIVTFFTFGDLKKAERYAALAAERLVEAQVVAGKGRPGLTEKTLARYENQLEKSIARVERAESKNKNTEKVIEVLARVGKATSIHLEVLAEIGEKLPEEDKPIVEKAMVVSLKGHQKAVAVLKAKNALGDVPEEVSLPEKVPQEVRERIQMRVQQDLAVEEALETFESFESIRDLCTKQGMPSEVCEIIPAEGFKSFEDLKNFSLEQGATPEIWAMLEAKCKELGVKTADECFIILSTASFKAYQETSPTMKILPERSKSFEELEADCLESSAGTGITAEQCALFEAKCKEAGAATADECYRGVDSEGNLIPPIEF